MSFQRSDVSFDAQCISGGLSNHDVTNIILIGGGGGGKIFRENIKI